MNHFSRFLKPGSLVELRLLEHLDREQRDDADHRPDAERHVAAVDVELIVVESVLHPTEPVPPSAFMASEIATKCSKNFDAMSS